MYLIKQGNLVQGVADYLDEAKEFTVRITRSRGVIDWSSYGEMLVNGSWSGWRIQRAA